MSKYKELRKEVEALITFAKVIGSRSTNPSMSLGSALSRLDQVLDEIYELDAKLMMIDIKPDYSQYETPAARKSDPITSHEADKRIKKTGKVHMWRLKVLEALIDYPDLTARELSIASGLPHEMVHKRLPELADRGLVKRTGRRTCTHSGYVAAMWEIA